MIADQPVVLNE